MITVYSVYPLKRPTVFGWLAGRSSKRRTEGFKRWTDGQVRRFSSFGRQGRRNAAAFAVTAFELVNTRNAEDIALLKMIPLIIILLATSALAADYHVRIVLARSLVRPDNDFCFPDSDPWLASSFSGRDYRCYGCLQIRQNSRREITEDGKITLHSTVYSYGDTRQQNGPQNKSD